MVVFRDEDLLFREICTSETKLWESVKVKEIVLVISLSVILDECVQMKYRQLSKWKTKTLSFYEWTLKSLNSCLGAVQSKQTTHKCKNINMKLCGVKPSNTYKGKQPVFLKSPARPFGLLDFIALKYHQSITLVQWDNNVKGWNQCHMAALNFH